MTLISAVPSNLPSLIFPPLPPVRLLCHNVGGHPPKAGYIDHVIAGTPVSRPPFYRCQFSFSNFIFLVNLDPYEDLSPSPASLSLYWTISLANRLSNEPSPSYGCTLITSSHYTPSAFCLFSGYRQSFVLGPQPSCLPPMTLVSMLFSPCVCGDLCFKFLTLSVFSQRGPWLQYAI